MQNRLIGAKRMTLEEKEELRVKLLAQKDKFELNNSGGYERIYPMNPNTIGSDQITDKLQTEYEYLIAASLSVWGEQMAGGGINARKRIDELIEKNSNAIKTNQTATAQTSTSKK